MNLSIVKTEEDFDAHHQSEIWLDVAKEICRRHRISFNKIERASGSEHIVFFVDDALVLKIYRPFRRCFERETDALESLGGKIAIRIPEIIYKGEFEQFQYVFQTRIGGDSITRQDWLKIDEKAQIKFISKLAKVLRQIHEINPNVGENNWAEFVKNRAETFIERQIAHGVNDKIIKVLLKYIEENLMLVPTESPTVFMHADVHFGNLSVIKKGENLEIAGLFDFADSRRGFFEYDFLAVGVLMIQGQREIQREFFKSYGYSENDLDEMMRKRLMMLTMLYETADLRRYAMRLKPEAVDFSLDELERGIWSFA
ncbi:MAG TPA: aminoglycoside phosphotransferase family protein [Pyrinomonadaceae bacterium]|nr:aminoglycoside phosphotransferase family protein [Pyrinomonadaceae bacterium]